MALTGKEAASCVSPSGMNVETCMVRRTGEDVNGAWAVGRAWNPDRVREPGARRAGVIRERDRDHPLECMIIDTAEAQAGRPHASVV